MSLQDNINRLKQATESHTGNGNGDDKNPLENLVHQPIRASQQNPQLVFRILPPAPGKELFYSEGRQWWVDTVNKAGKTKQMPVALAVEHQDTDPVQNLIDELEARNALPQNVFKRPNKPIIHYYMNVVPYVWANGTMQMQTDERGLPDVYVLDASNKTMTTLVEALGDPMNNPNENPNFIAQYNIAPTEEQKSWSFLSSGLALAVRITRTVNESNKVRYNTDIAQGYPLTSLPQGWETKLEDLDALMEPSYLTSPNYANWIVKQVSNAAGLSGNVQAPQRDNEAHQWNQQVVTPTSQASTFVAPQATPMAPQAPVQPSQAQYNQPAPFAPSAPTTPQQTPTRPTVVPAQATPVQPQQVKADPFANQAPSPLAQNASQFGAQPMAQVTPAASQAPTQPQAPVSSQSAPTAPVTPAQPQTAPTAPQATSEVPEVNASDLKDQLDSLGIDFDNDL